MESGGEQPKKPLSILVLNQLWLVEELRQMGHRVVTAGWQNNGYDVQFKVPQISVEELEALLPRGFVPDRIVYMDDSAPIGVHGLERLSIPSVYYSVDAHHHSYWHRYFGATFDLVLVAQKDYIPEFQKYNSNVKWFPLWASRIVAPQAEKSIGACFRGNLNPKWHPHRVSFFEELRKVAEIDADFGPYEEAYPRSKIVLNEAVNNDVNFRVFEALICGAMVITPEVGNGFNDLFVVGEDLVTYPPGDVAAAAEKIKYFLEHDAEREQIAARGHEKVSKLHSPMARARDLSNHLENLQCATNPHKCMAIALSYLICSKIFRKASEMLGDRMLKIAADALMHSAQTENNQSKEFENGVIICAHYLRHRGYEDDSRTLLQNVWGCMQNLSIVTYYHLHQLIRDNKENEARIIATQLVADPERLLAELPAIMSQTTERLEQYAPLG